MTDSSSDTGREVAGGRLRLIGQAEIQELRRRKIALLHNREGRRVTVEDSFSYYPDVAPALLDSAGNALVENPSKPKPREGREVAAMIAMDMTRHLMWLKKYAPDTYRRRLAEIRQLDPVAYGHMTDEQFEAAVVDVCRRVYGEPVTQKAYERQGRGGGYREVAL